MKPVIAAIIPARLSSSRLPGKVLLDINGTTMLKRVVANALRSKNISEIFVATCDDEVLRHVIEMENVRVIKTSSEHISGTSRCAEAVLKLDEKISHVILIQGDEPLLDPAHVDAISDAINAHPEIEAFNAVSEVNHDEMLDESIVKGVVNSNGDLVFLFRKAPFVRKKSSLKNVKKVQGLMAFKKDFLKSLLKLEASEIEKSESIEQMRIIENSMQLQSVATENVLQSVNTPRDLELVKAYVEKLERANGKN